MFVGQAVSPAHRGIGEHHNDETDKTILVTTGIGAVTLILMAPWANSQPPAGPGGPAGASGAGRGGGFGRGGATPFDYSNNDGYLSLFDGQTLNNWEGNTSLWSVKDGSLYIHPSCEHPTGTTYIYWTGGEASDFILKYELKGTEQVNGGMQFRSYLTADRNTPFRYPGRGGGGTLVNPAAAGRGPGGFGGGRAGSGGFGGGRGGSGRGGGRGPACANPGTLPPQSEMAKWDLNGPQADFDANNQFSAMFYEQGGRGIIMTPGHVLEAEAGKPVQDIATLADKATLDSWFHKDDFNQFMIIAKGNTTSIYMNGHLITLFIDNDPIYFRASGKLGPEVESTGEYWVRNIYLKRL